MSQKAFDDLGRPVSSTRSDLTVTTDQSGVGGLPASATATPQATGDFPGEPITATTTRSLTGAATSRTLQQGDEVSTATAVTYDAAGDVVAATDAEGRRTTYTYAADGQPLTRTSPSGAVTTYAYAADSGLRTGVTVTAPGRPTRAVTYTRVAEGQPGAGQVRTVSDGTATMTYGYDVDGHRTSVSYPDGTSTRADYDDTGRLTSATDVTGAVTSFAYDPTDGTLTSATQRRGGAVITSVAYTYDAMGRIATTTRGNGTVTRNSYTPRNQLAGQSTTTADGRVLEAHSYTYDGHHNPATRTDTYPAGGSATAKVGTWTTVYSYDAYDRLVRSAVHVGGLVAGAPTGLPVTTTAYTVDLGGDVVATTTTTRAPGPRQVVSRTTSTNTVDDSGRLTARTTGSTTTTQSFDDDGRVLTSLSGARTTYGADGSPSTTALPDGTSTTYALWPDGSRRSATTTTPDGATSAVTYHYGVDGVLVNDSTSDTSTATGTATTASYLLTTAREARTLLPRTATSGGVTGTPAATLDTGAGVGYYLRDRHTSVTALVDDAGAVTATYAYGDYGTPARADGRAASSPRADGGRTNPYTYLGASPRGPVLEATSGLMRFAQRTYAPGQGRFLSPDPVDAHNRYQGFNANPVTYLDLAGQVSTADIVLEAVFAVLMIASAVVTAGASIAAVGAIGAAVEAGADLTVGVVANATASVVGTVANLTGGVTGALLTVNDSVAAADGKGFLSSSQRDALSLANNVATAVGGVSGLLEGATDEAVTALQGATEEAKNPFGIVKKTDLGYFNDPTPVSAGDSAADFGAPWYADGKGPSFKEPDTLDDEPLTLTQRDPNFNPAILDLPQAGPTDVGMTVGRQALPMPLEDVLAGTQTLTSADRTALLSDTTITTLSDAGSEGAQLKQQLNEGIPATVDAVDQVVLGKDLPLYTPSDPGAYGPVGVFENTNVILLSPTSGTGTANASGVLQ